MTLDAFHTEQGALSNHSYTDVVLYEVWDNFNACVTLGLGGFYKDIRYVVVSVLASVVGCSMCMVVPCATRDSRTIWCCTMRSVHVHDVRFLHCRVSVALLATSLNLNSLSLTF